MSESQSTDAHTDTPSGPPRELPNDLELAPAQWQAQVVPAGNANIIIGEVTHIHIAKSVWHEGRIDPERLKPVCRLAGSWYAKLGELVYLQRPLWSEVQSSADLAGMPRVGERVERIARQSTQRDNNNTATKQGSDNDVQS